MKRSIFLLITFLGAGGYLGASAPSAGVSYTDREALVDLHLPKKKQPRLLTSNDVPSVDDDTALLPLVSPEGDFDKDGALDVALSGIYGNPDGSEPYFLLVVAERTHLSTKKQLLFEEGPQPYFLFPPGTTGDGDPKNQAFSVSFCTACSTGWDYYWDDSNQRFNRVPWTTRSVRVQKMVTEEAIVLPEEVVNQALRVVGALPDVIAFVKACETAKTPIRTQVNPGQKIGERWQTVFVLIDTRTKKGRVPYDTIEVNLETNQVIKRLR